VVSLLSAALALSSVGFAALLWVQERLERQLSVRPSITFMTQDDDAEPIVGIGIESHGPGPAMIQSVTYHADRKRVKDAAAAAAYCKLDTRALRLMEFDPGDTFGPNQRDWLFAAARRARRPSTGSWAALATTLP
jgi:hypothetical protein